MMAPILVELKNSIGDAAHIIKIDVDQSPQAASVFKVQSVPTLMIFKNGKAVWRVSGVLPASALEAELRKHV